MMQKRLVTKMLYVEWPKGARILRELRIRTGSFGTYGELGDCTGVQLRSALYPRALSFDDLEVLLDILRSENARFEISVGLDEWVGQYDYPGLDWSAACDYEVRQAISK